MDRAKKRSAEEAEGEGGMECVSIDRPVDSPADPMAEKKAERQREPKEKRTYSLRVKLIRLIDSVVSELGIDSCELVDELMTIALKGCAKPTVTNDIKAMMARRKRSAA